MGSSVLDLLKQANTKTVTLPHSTRSARDAGLIGDGDEIVARIRKVTAKETAQTIGRVPRLLAVFREKRDDETPREFAERMQKQALEDPELYAAVLQKSAEDARTLAALGVVALGVRKAVAQEDGQVEHVLELQDVELRLDGDLTPERVLGGDLDLVADEVALWSTGHRSAEAEALTGRDGRRVGGVDRTGQFPGERPGDPAQPHREGDGPDAEPVP